MLRLSLDGLFNVLEYGISFIYFIYILPLYAEDWLKLLFIQDAVSSFEQNRFKFIVSFGCAAV